MFCRFGEGLVGVVDLDFWVAGSGSGKCLVGVV